MGCVELMCSMLTCIGELGYQSLKNKKSKYSILNIDSVYVPPSPKFPSILFYGQPFSSYRNSDTTVPNDSK